MTVTLTKHKLTYFPIPKVACTSLKQMFYRIETGQPFVPQTAKDDGLRQNIHDVYPTRPFAELERSLIADHERLVVVRDPIRRFLSCYSNRVLHHWELSKQHISPDMIAEGATPNPSLDEFIEKLGLYRRVSRSIHHHSAPMVRYIGRNPDYFQGLFNIRQMEQFTTRVQRITGVDFVPGRSQTGGPKIDVNSLKPRQIKKLRKIYEADYDIYGRYLENS